MRGHGLAAQCFFVIALVSKGITAQSESCVGRCDDPLDTSFPCQCNHACTNHGDCCDDYLTVCDSASSCGGRCGSAYIPGLSCQCNSECGQHSNWERASFGEEMALGGGISFTFTWNGASKPYGSMWLGTSPELEMALYSVCFMSRPNKKCHVTLMGQDVYIQTWTENAGDETLVGSSYPDWSL